MHIAGLRAIKELAFSIVHIIVERNLGFEAEHMQRALIEEEGVIFYRDVQAGRTGVLTTENVKLGAMTLTNIMLRESRVHLASDRTLVSQVRNICVYVIMITFVILDEYFTPQDPPAARRRLREQLEIYSFQFKTPDNVFQKGRFALSGKVGGLKDDVVICLQLGLYWTETARLVWHSNNT